MEIAALLRDTTQLLSRAGVPSPDVDSVALVAHLLGVTGSEVRTAAARGDALPATADLDTFATRVMRRSEREPLQHITGIAHFRDLDLEVGAGVFIPRPETETVAQAAIDAARRLGPGRDGIVRVTDLCAGSGAIGLSVATEVPDARVSLLEASDEAAVYLRINSRRQSAEVRARVRTMMGDARRCLHLFDQCADVVVSNPPYIPPGSVPRDPEVADYDPPQALYGLGEDGLDLPRAIVNEAARLLRVGGVLVMEHADSQGTALREFVASSQWWDEVATHQDLNGRDRFLVATRVGV
ncbi:peptide chain release factor N(5)-glutamine methyltransferase [Demequina aurantiaca]|uniref:peptide chain release factor N(5)-glutamine methyltransferase n=1 Tax=Demequina aurantiaca TaxID=676200 RepID=UPI003D34D5B9